MDHLDERIVDVDNSWRDGIKTTTSSLEKRIIEVHKECIDKLTREITAQEGQVKSATEVTHVVPLTRTQKEINQLIEITVSKFQTMLQAEVSKLYKQIQTMQTAVIIPNSAVHDTEKDKR